MSNDHENMEAETEAGTMKEVSSQWMNVLLQQMPVEIAQQLLRP